MDRKFKNAIQEQGLEQTGRFYGLYQGIVIENEDPEKRGRLKVKIPSVLANQVFEKWIYGKSIFNGNTIGIWAIPSVGSGVWITFINGDPTMPIWEMGWFSDKEIPKEFKERYLDGITLKNDRIFIQSKKASIEFFEDGNIEIIANEKIDITANADITVNAQSGKIDLKNTSQNLNGLFSELKTILLTLKVALNGTPISNTLTPDTILKVNTWFVKVGQLLK
ncbi:phage baseplate assembly protein V [Bernardetia sp. Wsw4-3y2]|uniref:phage baseplate assembly protein V n=1 Tax=Bernardetia sp. Wsw4-3y2 TaxID=3127471 RepID=UPI0030CC7D8E